MIYSNKIIKLDNETFLLKNYKKRRKLISFIILLYSVIVIIEVILIIKDIQDMNIWVFFQLIFFSSLYIFLIYIANDVKEIIFNNYKQKIIFNYGLFFKKKKEININELKEISINYSPEDIPNRARRIIGKKYNVDLIDNNLNAYRIYQSMVYDDELKTFAKNISEIIRIGLIDKNNVEGYMNIYRKIII